MNTNKHKHTDETLTGEVALDLDYVISDYDEVEERRFHESQEVSSETDIDFDY